MNDTALPAPDSSALHPQLHRAPPAEVRWAVRLMWLALAINLIQYALYLPQAVRTATSMSSSAHPALDVLLMPGIGVLLSICLNLAIYHGKNWARIGKLLIEAGALAFQLTFTAGLGGFEYVSAALSPAANFAALYLVFFTAGRLWFKRPARMP